jgi:hypothetical protein
VIGKTPGSIEHPDLSAARMSIIFTDADPAGAQLTDSTLFGDVIWALQRRLPASRPVSSAHEHHIYRRRSGRRAAYRSKSFPILMRNDPDL